MTSQAVTVVNQLGMHARAAAKFVHLATRFQAQVRHFDTVASFPQLDSLDAGGTYIQTNNRF